MALSDTARLIASLELQDKFSRPAGQINTSLTKMERGFSQMGTGASRVATGLSNLGTRAALAAAGGLTAVVTTAASFEDAFAGVRKTVDATDAELDKLQDSFREMARTIPVSFEELSALGETAGALGIATENIEEFTRVTALLGVTTDVSAQDAATALGQLSNVLGLTAEDYDNFASTLVDLGNKGASTEAQILQIASRAGAGAKLVGFAADETLAWASAVANLGIEVEAGGSALQQFTLQAAKNVEITDRLALMGKTAGTTGAAFKKAFEQDASGALQEFLAGLGKLDRGAQLKVLDDLNLKGIRMQRALLGLANGTDNITDSLRVANEEWKRNSALTTEAEKRNKTTAKQFQLLKNNVRDVAATIGEQLLPVANDLIKDFIGFLNKPATQKGIKDFGKNLAGGIRDFIAAAKEGDFNSLIDTFKSAASIAKTAFDAFNALPAGLKGAIIGGILINKATGGALTDIVGGARQLIGGAASVIGALRGSSPANPLFTKEVGLGGAGGGPGGALGGGKLGTILKLAAAPLIVGIGHELTQGIARLISGKNPLGEAGKTITLGSSTFPKGTQPVAVKEFPKPLFDSIGDQIKVLERRVDRKLEEGDVHAARMADRQAELLNQLRGSIRGGFNDVIPKLGETNRALSVANRNLQDGNARQREIASRVAEARDRIGSGFQASNAHLGTIASKDFSPNVNAYFTANTTVSISEVTRASVSNQFATGAGFTSGGNSINP